MMAAQDKKVLVLLFNRFTNDSRVLKECTSLAAAGYRVELWATYGADLPEHETINGFEVWRKFGKPAVKKHPAKAGHRRTPGQGMAPRLGHGTRSALYLGSKFLQKVSPVLHDATKSVYIRVEDVMVKVAKGKYPALNKLKADLSLRPHLARWSRRRADLTPVPKFDFIHCNDLGPLPMAVAMKKRNPGTRISERLDCERTVARLALLLVTALFCVMALAEDSKFGADMPAMSPALQSMQSFYNFKFTADGYPGRSDGFDHPIYGVYVLNDYVEQYKKQPAGALKQGIETVALAAIRRMHNFHNGLVFWYPADTVARNSKKHYSGLTQAYYAVALYRAYAVTRNPTILAASEQVYASLKIPNDEGGVFFSDGNGVTIAEVPQEPNSWILNGWLSALVALDDYVTLTNSSDAQKLLRDNLESLRAKLHLFDNPTYRNSNYGLTGFSYARIRFGRASAIDFIGDYEYEIPGERTYKLAAGPTKRWSYYYFSANVDAAGKPLRNIVKLNLVLSRASAPRQNSLYFTTKANQATVAALEILSGKYSPTKSTPVEATWKKLSELEILPGTHRHRVDLAWNADTLAAIYPTNFVKRIDGRNVNVYHPIHINQLLVLYKKHGINEFKQWSETWAKYICEWRELTLYDEVHVKAVETRTLPPGPLAPRGSCVSK